MLPEEYGGSGMSMLEGVVVYEELGRALAPSPHFVSAVLRRRHRCCAPAPTSSSRRVAPGDRHAARPSSRRRGSSPSDGFGPKGVQATATGRRRRLRPRRHQVARALRVVGRPARSCWPAPATAPTTSTCSSSTRRPTASRSPSSSRSRSDTQYQVDLDGVRVAADRPHRRRRHRLGRRGTTSCTTASSCSPRRPIGGAALRPRHHRAVRQGPRAVRQAARRLPGASPTTWPTP